MPAMLLKTLLLVALMLGTTHAQYSASGNDCLWCPEVCQKSPNPAFTTHCDLSVVLIVDESGSIDDYPDHTQDVIDAVKAFWTSLATTIDLGGQARLGGVRFSSGSSSFTSNKIRTLDSAYVSSLNNWADNSYSPGGSTNWAYALKRTRTTDWTNEMDEPQHPSIVIMFTDGQPTVPNPDSSSTSSDRCVNSRRSKCPAIQQFAGYDFDSRYGGGPDDMATACYQADLLKRGVDGKAGSRLFVVGVGNLLEDGATMCSDLSGPTLWDGEANSFATADYYTNPDLDELGKVLYSVAIGLCPCLQPQLPCQDHDDHPCQIQFRAKTRISAISRTVTFPANSVTYGYMFFDFTDPLNKKVAYQLLPPHTLGDNPLTTNDVAVREDIHNPCEVSRRISCQGRCFILNERSILPRLFLEQGDVSGIPTNIANPTGTACTTTYTKAPPSSGIAPETIRYLWGHSNGGGWTLCAAQDYDGAIYEFFKADGTTRGTIPATPPFTEFSSGAAFTFDKDSSMCAATLCSNGVEVVFIIDEQQDVTDTEYSHMKNYIKGIVDTFDPDTPIGNIKFGFIQTNDGNPIPGNPVQQLANNFGSFKSAIQGLNKAAGTSDFKKSQEKAMEFFWSGQKTVPRYLVTIVGGPQRNEGGSPSFAELDQMAIDHGVERWAVGVASGGNDAAFLRDLSSQDGYDHSSILSTSDLLEFDIPFMSSKLCPDGSLCGAGCAGFCGCVDDCRCPTECSGSPCGPRACTNPAIGCVGENFDGCTDYDECTADSCDTDAPGGPQCTYEPLVCNDNDKCTTDTCDPGVLGGCVFSPIEPCNDANPCTSDSCDKNLGCVFTPIPCCSSTDPCTVGPACTDNNLCTIDTCISDSSQYSHSRSCDDLPLDQVAACRTALATEGQCKYCSFVDVECEDKNCVVNTCAPGTGKCTDVASTTTCNDGEWCTDDECVESQGGCVYTDNTYQCPHLNNPCLRGYCDDDATDRASRCKTNPVSCDDNDGCTTDSCSGGNCVYTPIASDSCSDQDVCTADQCVSGSIPGFTKADDCVNTPICDTSAAGLASCFLNPCTDFARMGIPYPCDLGDACTEITCVRGAFTCTDLNNAAPPLQASVGPGISGYYEFTCQSRTKDLQTEVCDSKAVFDACNTHTCHPTDGCVSTYIGNLCDDSDVCTDDSCHPVNGCTYVDNSARCDDNDKCTVDTCDPVSGCANGPRTVCNDGLYCTIDAPCDPATGLCPTPTNRTCNDGDDCTDDSCDDTADKCVYTETPLKPGCCATNPCYNGGFQCDDGDSCTTDTCTYDPMVDCLAFTCTHVPLVFAEYCTNGESDTDMCISYNCDGTGADAVCNTTSVTDCDDTDLCTTDSCNATTGCVNDPIDVASVCTDNNVCTTDVCDPLLGCQNLQDVVCDDGINCTIDTCHPVQGCIYTPKVCSTSGFCFDDYCEELTGTCVSDFNCTTCPPADPCVTSPCDDTMGCTIDTCTPDPAGPETGVFRDGSLADCTHTRACSYIPRVCPTDPTDALCNPVACVEDTDAGYLCEFTPVVCDDLSVCTDDSCTNGTCTYAPRPACDDNDKCTSDSCDPVSGCVFLSNVVCNDNNACTSDLCVKDMGCVYTPISCDDDSKCTIDTCSTSTGCVYTPVTDCTCDPDPCASTACGDGDGCTADVCISDFNIWPQTGRCSQLPAPHNTWCAGNLSASCSATYCYSGPRNPCPDTNCTQFDCDSATGVCAVSGRTSCDDSDPCTIDRCVEAEGGCTYTPRVCAQFNACEIRTCLPGNNGTSWSCNVTGAITCNDNDACTADSCDPGQGCIYDPKRCASASECHIISGCDAVTGECQQFLLTSLLDFCGTCKGDNTACFFQNTNDLKNAAGIAGGVVAAIVIAAVIAIILAIIASKKGYDHYAALSNARAAGLNMNPMFKSNAGASEAGNAFEEL